MNNALALLLTLVIMFIGLTLIIGGPGAVGSLFAPFLSGMRLAVQALFAALVVLVLVAALLSGKRSATSQTRASQNGVEDGVNQAGARNR